jgi:dTMP kinase
LEAGQAAKRRENTGQEPDRLELEKQEFFEAVRSEYLKLAEAEPNRFLVISAEGTPEEIFAQIQAKLDELLA